MRFLIVWSFFLAARCLAIDVIDLSIYRAEKPSSVEESLYKAYALREECWKKTDVAYIACREKNQNSDIKLPCEKLEAKAIAFCNDFYWSWAGALQTEDHKLCAMERTYENPRTGEETLVSIHATECKRCDAEKTLDGPIVRFQKKGAEDEFGQPVHATCGQLYYPEDYSWSAPVKCACEPNIHNNNPLGFNPLQPPVIEFDFTKAPGLILRPRGVPHRPMALRAPAATRARGIAPTRASARGVTHR